MHEAARSHRRLGFLAATLLAALLCIASAADAQCGRDYRAKPAHSDIPGGAPLAIGDSVLADAVPLLARYGFEVDGMVCRQMSQGLSLLRARDGRLPHLVVLALGTNGEVTPEQIDTALSILGPRRILVLVTPYGSVAPSSPAVIRAAAASHPGRIVLLDWDRLAAEHPDWLASDGVHLGGPAGIAAFAEMIAGVLPDASSASSRAPMSPDGQVSAEGQAGGERQVSGEGDGTPNPGMPITIQPPPGHRNSPDRHAAPTSSVAASRSVLAGLGALLQAVATSTMVLW